MSIANAMKKCSPGITIEQILNLNSNNELIELISDKLIQPSLRYPSVLLRFIKRNSELLNTCLNDFDTSHTLHDFVDVVSSS